MSVTILIYLWDDAGGGSDAVGDTGGSDMIGVSCCSGEFVPLLIPNKGSEFDLKTLGSSLELAWTRNPDRGTVE